MECPRLDCRIDRGAPNSPVARTATARRIAKRCYADPDALVVSDFEIQMRRCFLRSGCLLMRETRDSEKKVRDFEKLKLHSIQSIIIV